MKARVAARSGRWCGLVLVVAAIGAGGTPWIVDAAAAQADGPVDAGEALVVDAEDHSTPLTEGDADTTFTLRLPDGSSCPGDSANDDWRVQSYLVPAAEVRPVRFGSIGPENPEGDLHADPRWALYGVDTVPFVQAMTAQNGAPGEPGLIVGIPVLSLGLFDPTRLPPGNYRLGIACTYFRDTASYWDTEIVVTADPDVEPGGLRWRLATAPERAPVGGASGSKPWVWIIVGTGALAAVVVGFVLLPRLARRTLSKELT